VVRQTPERVVRALKPASLLSRQQSRKSAPAIHLTTDNNITLSAIIVLVQALVLV
jgi:hypothetical protein